MHLLPECEIYPLPELGAKTEKRIARLSVLQEFSSKGFGMPTKGNSLYIVRIKRCAKTANDWYDHLLSYVFHAVDFSTASVLSKTRVNSEFAHLVDQDHQIVAEHFAQRLVDHRHVRLAAKAVPKLPLHHAEGGFHVRPLVVVSQEIAAPPPRNLGRNWRGATSGWFTAAATWA